MNNKIITISTLLISLTAIVIAAMVLQKPDEKLKVAYVEYTRVYEEFLGRKDGGERFQEATKLKRAYIDTLKINLEREISAYNLNSTRMSTKQKREREQSLQQAQVHLQEEAQKVQEFVNSKDQEISIEVADDLFEMVEEYAQQKGYDLLIKKESVLVYGQELMDITDEVIKVVNDQYQSKQKK